MKIKSIKAILLVLGVFGAFMTFETCRKRSSSMKEEDEPKEITVELRYYNMNWGHGFIADKIADDAQEVAVPLGLTFELSTNIKNWHITSFESEPQEAFTRGGDVITGKKKGSAKIRIENKENPQVFRELTLKTLTDLGVYFDPVSSEGSLSSDVKLITIKGANTNYQLETSVGVAESLGLSFFGTNANAQTINDAFTIKIVPEGIIEIGRHLFEQAGDKIGLLRFLTRENSGEATIQFINKEDRSVIRCLKVIVRPRDPRS